jgi:hypothetical protein
VCGKARASEFTRLSLSTEVVIQVPTRKGPDFVFAAKYRTQCPICKEYIYPDDKVLFPDRESKYVVHEACYGKLPTQASNPSPPASMSPGQGGLRPEPSGTLKHEAPGAPAAVPAQAIAESPEFAERVFVMLSCWVPSDKAEGVLKAFLEARK